MVCRVVSVRVELPLRDQSASICAHKQDENDSDETDWISVTESDAAIAPTPHGKISNHPHEKKSPFNVKTGEQENTVQTFP